MILEKNNTLRAVLGPTNTGKTYLAFERMLSYNSGMFGFPLRLLARENYDRAIKKKDKDSIALITGEEKITPPESRYFFCTVESMPETTKLDFVAIDEIQMASDFERGHIFTDRILNFRGVYETMLLGSLTIENTIKILFPNINIERRDRFSKLSFSKKQNIKKLKPKTAVIAFNINSVYEIAETLRSQKGGAAVVLGALSPRTRNAQVEMYENQNVDFLVATDAIGMGLNLNIDHVAFSSLKKFDGRFRRNLNLSEIGQIAGRAGRYKNDGTFGLTEKAENLDPTSITAIENNNFSPIKSIYWRNTQIDFSSVKGVLNSLNWNPPLSIFMKKRNAEDEKSFKTLSSDSDIITYLTSYNNIKLLWDVCKIPDFQKLMTESYIEFIKNVFIHLMMSNNYIPDNWIHQNVNRLNNTFGDIDTLSKRIAHIRTWTYISNHAEWIKNREYWQETTRKIEDKLSDELHNKLKLRFVDQQGTYFIDKIKKKNNLNVEFKDNNIVEVEGSNIGYFNGFNLVLNENKKENISTLVNNSAKKYILRMIPERVRALINAPNDAFNLGKISELKMNDIINVCWGKDIVAYLDKGDNIFSPKINILNSNLLDHEDREKVINKLQKWIDQKINDLLDPIKNNTNDISKSPTVRSITYTIFHDLGCTKKNDIPISFNKLSDEEKKDLAKLHIRTGIEFFYLTNFLKKNAIELRAMLWKIFHGYSKAHSYPLPNDGRVYFNIDINLPINYWHAIGYIRIKNLAIRVDIFERLFFLTRQKYRFGPFTEHPNLMNLIGCNADQLKEILLFLNYESITMGNEQLLFFQKNTQKINKKNVRTKKIAEKINNNQSKKKLDEMKLNSPFAALSSYFNKS